MIWQTCQSVVVVWMMALACWAAGAPVVRRMPTLAEDPPGRLLWALAIGAMLWAVGIAALGGLGLLYMPLVGGLTWAAFLAGFYQFLRELEGFSSILRTSPGSFAALPWHSVKKSPAPLPGSNGLWFAWHSLAQAAADLLPTKKGKMSPVASPVSLPGNDPLPYEHSPPPDLVGPGGLPLWLPEGEPALAAPSELLAGPGEQPYEGFPLQEDSETGGCQQTASPARSPGKPFWRVDRPEDLLGSKAEANPLVPPPGWLQYCLASLAAGAMCTTLLIALAPPTHPEALVYHLELPKRWLEAHRIVEGAYPDGHYPGLAHMWFLWALALDGEVAAQVVHWQWGVMFGCTAWYLARLFLERSWAWMAGAVVVLAPGVLYQMTAPLPDLTMATCCTLAMAAWWQACRPPGSRAPSGGNAACQNSPFQQAEWFLLAGLAFAGAIAIQPAALLMGPVLLGLWGLCYWQQPSRRSNLLRGAIRATGLALLGIGAWYAWAAWHQGGSISLLAEGLSPDSITASETAPLVDGKSLWGGGWLGWLSAPWTITMMPERFGDRQYAVGALWLAVLPGLFWTQRRRSLELLLVLAGGYFLVWLFWGPNLRLLLPSLPMLAPAAIWVWSQMGRMDRLARWAAGAGLAICLLIPVGQMGRQLPEYLPTALGWETREEFLYRIEPSYPAAALANLLLGPDAKILTQELKTCYFDSLMVPEPVYRRQSQYDQKLHQPGDLARLLRQDGFTHILLMEKFPPKALPASVSDRGIASQARLPGLVDAELRLPQSGLQELSQYQLTDHQGVVHRYRLIAIR